MEGLSLQSLLIPTVVTLSRRESFHFLGARTNIYPQVGSVVCWNESLHRPVGSVGTHHSANLWAYAATLLMQSDCIGINEYVNPHLSNSYFRLVCHAPLVTL
jgi:hypothetical protein